MNQTFFKRPDEIHDPLYVITPIFNPIRYRARWKHYKNFERYIIDSGAHLVTIEASFGDRSNVITEKVHEKHTIIHVRTKHEIWIKENLINIAIQMLPHDWKYVGWVDADVLFARPDWVGETIHQLQHYDFVQMFSFAEDLNATFEPIHKHVSFGYAYHHGLEEGLRYEHWHPGYAWAATREAINHLGGLIDWGILGSGDRHMAAALIGKVRTSVNHRISNRYLSLLDEWERRAEKHIRRNIGYVEGLLLHYWHGSKQNRGYKDRWKILVDNCFDPDIDLKKDSYGLWQLTDRSLRLRDQIRKYFRQRNEDAI
jgi:hypothetical protein